MQTLARRTAALAGWQRYLLAALLGALAATALAPLHALPALVAGFTGLVWLLDGAAGRLRRFLTAWCFAWGHFAAGLYWIGHAFFVDAEQFAWLVPFPVIGLPALLALFPALAVAALVPARLPGAARVLALALAWTVSELARGHLFTGFPWNLLGYVWAFSDAALQPVALIGPYGLGLLTVTAAALPALFGDGAWRQAAAWCAGAWLVLALGAGWGWMRLPEGPAPVVAGVQLRLVQPNIDQQQKWLEEERRRNLQLFLRLSAGPGAERVTHWVWPETAVPYYVDMEPGALAPLTELVGEDGMLLTGAPRRTPPGAPSLQVWNSLHAIDARGLRDTYDKRHLVPFGEYLPLRWLLARIGLHRLAFGTLDFSAGQGDGIMRLPGLPPLRALICYEAIFPGGIDAGGERPGWLLNITNDAWFGVSSGPYQHFAMARARAIEQGVALVRSANTGISAIVDPYGRVVGELALDTAGVLDGPLPRPLAAMPPYGRLGEIMLLPLAAALSLLAALAARRRSREPGTGARTPGAGG